MAPKRPSWSSGSRAGGGYPASKTRRSGEESVGMASIVSGVHEGPQGSSSHTTSQSSKMKHQSDRPSTQHVDIDTIDRYGQITPLMCEIASEFTMADITCLLANIQRQVLKSPARAKKVMAACPELCQSLIHAQLATGMMNEQTTKMAALSEEQLKVVQELENQRKSDHLALCLNLLGREDSGMTDEEGVAGSSGEVVHQDSGIEALATEVIKNRPMLETILAATPTDMMKFPAEQRGKIRELQKILGAKGYSVAALKSLPTI